MAITTYTQLKDAIAKFLARDDLTDQLGNFVQLAEARMSRMLDTRSQINRVNASTVAGSEFISLPTDLRQIESVKLNTTPSRVLEYLPPADYYRLNSTDAGGTPRYYTIIGTTIGMRPIPDAVVGVQMIYREDLDELSDTQPTNTILSRHSDAYLYGSLAAASVFLMDDQRAATFDQVFTRTIEEIKQDTANSKFGGPLVMQSEYTGV